MEKSETEKEIEAFIKENSDMLYKQTSEDIGSRWKEAGKDKKLAKDGKFTKHLANSGMYKFNGLNTVKDKEKFIEGSKDWMLKLA
mmetsp:Transcript_17480/g.18143  ORF Transcript_17480/g.18143 Transcript_17480/m.18143 type:complete len:85 (+) Transcript_17480:1-255(+)